MRLNRNAKLKSELHFDGDMVRPVGQKEYMSTQDYVNTLLGNEEFYRKQKGGMKP